jgi:hypothetical protein
MARTNLPLTAFVPNGGLADPAGTAIDQANGMNVATVSETIPPARSGYRGIVFRVANTAGSAYNFIVRAGVNPPAFTKDLGDLTVSVPATTGVRWVGPFDMSRFAQSDDSINVDFSGSFAGTITAFSVPRSFAN